MTGETERPTRQKRPWIAAVLAAIVPGLGHVYVRMWARALLWFLLYLLATRVFLPTDALPESVSLTAISDAVAAVPLQTAVLLVSIGLLNVLDAFLMTRYHNEAVAFEQSGRRRCPQCGREVDADLDFCHWCTTRLENATGDPSQ